VTWAMLRRCVAIATFAASLLRHAGAQAGAPPGTGVPTGPATSARAAACVPRGRLVRDPLPFVSTGRLLATLAELTAIGGDALYRSSASRGEAAAFDLVARRLGELPYLASAGLALERQPFRTNLGGEVWEARVLLTTAGSAGETEVPAHALQPHRDDLLRALRLDSDGHLNDTDRNPVEVSGAAIVVRTLAQLNGLSSATAQGRVVVLDYALVDRALLGTTEAVTRANQLLARQPGAIVLVTAFSNTQGSSHGSFVGDLGAFTLARDVAARPTLYVRLEDLGAAGIASWNDLSRVTAVRVRWDADVLSPGASQNLIARIPGADPSRAVILGAHLDSPNSPGAMDDGSGAVALLEIARAIEAARARPATDLYLCWFGSHERGLFGSSVFLATHQELLDRAVAMLEVDCLRRPLDGLASELTLEAWSFAAQGDARLPWPEYVRSAVSARDLWPVPFDSPGIVSDNTCFTAFDVPNADLIYLDRGEQADPHYTGHLHDPYDTVEVAADVAPVLADMTRTALAAALAAGREQPELRVTPRPDRRAVFVASHTESPHMTATALVDFSMTLAWEGFDVDVIPYGTPVTSADLTGAALVVVSPVHDWPSPEGEPSIYQEGWNAAEVEALRQYVAGGGLLVLTNSRYRMKYLNQLWESNEDWNAAALAQAFGVTWLGGTLTSATSATRGTSPLVAGVASLALAAGNSVPFIFTGGESIAHVGAQNVAALLRPGGGPGEVLVLADLGILGAGADGPANLTFWRNLAAYARDR
jgi:hypothetical protein